MIFESWLVHKIKFACVMLAATAMFSWCQGSTANSENTVNGYPFAMCSNAAILNNPEYPMKLINTGARMCRTDVAFCSVRKGPTNDPTKWNWNEFERIRQLKKANPELDWLPVIGYGTSWSEDPRFKSVTGSDVSCPPQGILIEPVTSPANLYGHYVFETVKRYKDIINCWESWNEPDLPDHAFFKGSGKEFLPYQKACYLAAKKADPNCSVLFAGLCFANAEGYLYSHKLNPPSPYPPKSSFFEEYLKACVNDPAAKANNYYFDIMNQHSYSRATDLFDYSDINRNLMRTYLKQEKPIWITEMGWSDSGGTWGGSADEYCDYILQSFVWGKLAGVERFFHFQLDNSNGHGLYTSMLGSPKPVLNTYREVLTKELADAKLSAQLHGNRGVGFLNGNSPYRPSWTTGFNLFEFKSSHRNRRILVAFADTSKAVDVKILANAKSATLIDRHGNRCVVNASNGNYLLHLSGATNVAGWPTLNDAKSKALGTPEHLVGGPTMILVEQLN